MQEEVNRILTDNLSSILFAATKEATENLIYEKSNNYQAINRITFDKPIITNELKVVLSKKEKKIPVSLYKISAYAEKQPQPLNQKIVFKQDFERNNHKVLDCNIGI